MTPRPTVTYDGKTYKLRSSKTEVPDLDSWPRIHALVWVMQNTYPRGYSQAPSPLAGLGDAVRVSTR